MTKAFQQEIEQADKILVGIGEEFAEQFLKVHSRQEWAELEKQDPLQADIERLQYLDRITLEDPVIRAYRNLEKLLSKKDYFIVTTCNDDKIFRSGLNQEKHIVTPCGTFQYLQCSNRCNDDFLPLSECRGQDISKIRCPGCGEKVAFNKISAEHYNEAGYLLQWNEYQQWLTKTLNRKLLVLELGVDFSYPTVIRWPFEKVVYFNKQAKFYRVNETLYQMTNEIKDKGISISQNAVDFLLDITTTNEQMKLKS